MAENQKCNVSLYMSMTSNRHNNAASTISED